MEPTGSGNLHDRITLELPMRKPFLPVAVRTAEEGSAVLGLGPGRSMRLALAVEEIFAYLCSTVREDRMLQFRLDSGGYFVQASFEFQAQDLNLHALNLTATATPDDEDSLASLGLLVASRTVDRFNVERFGMGQVRVRLVQEKEYPAGRADSTEAACHAPFSIVRTPASGDLKLAVERAAAAYPSRLCPSGFQQPGKIVDMVAGGEYAAVIAADARGNPSGLLLWHFPGTQSSAFCGPYVWAQSPDERQEVARRLTDEFLSLVARTKAVCAFSELATPDLPEGYFESLGELNIWSEAEGQVRQPAWYRYLREDLGAAVWAHPDVQPFLEEEYDRLVFVRDLRATRRQGEHISPFSVFAADIQRDRQQVVLRALWDGLDVAANLAAHIDVLRQENLRNVFFHLDLSQSWQADIAPALMANGFAPRLILPYAGQSDIVVFQWTGAEAAN